MDLVHSVWSQFDGTLKKLLMFQNHLATLDSSETNLAKIAHMVKAITILMHTYRPSISTAPLQKWLSANLEQKKMYWCKLFQYIQKVITLATSARSWKDNLWNDSDYSQKIFEIFLSVEQNFVRGDTASTDAFVKHVLAEIEHFADESRAVGSSTGACKDSMGSEFNMFKIEQRLSVSEMTYICAFYDVLRCLQSQ